MTPEQQEIYDKELERIKRGGICEHEAFVVDSIQATYDSNPVPVEPKLVGFSNDLDPYYVTYYKNWDEINILINHIRKTAVEAWGEENPAPYMIYPLSGIDVDPITGDMSFVKRGE